MTAVLHPQAHEERRGPLTLLDDVRALARLRPADAARLSEILSTFARHGLLTVVRTGGRFVVSPRQQPPKAVAVALRRSFVDLGPTFVKLGQLIASSPGLFPPVLSDEMRSLLDDVPPEPTARIRMVIERSFGEPVDVLFPEFDDEPIAAASIAQVHRARLRDGTLVAVKVRRPGLRRRIERDLRLLRVVAATITRVSPAGDAMNLVAVVDDLRETTRAELDLRREARDMAEFARNLGDREGPDAIVVPDPIDGLVSERVLTMTFVEGVSVDDGDALRAAGFDLEDLVRRGARAWFESALVHGLFHGDIHAGNLFVTPTGQVAFLDFGIMGRFDERLRGLLRSLLPAAVAQDHRAMVEGLVALGAVTGPIDVDAAAADLAAATGPMMDRPLGELSYGELLDQTVTIARRHHIRMPKELVLVSKQLVYFERYAKDLAPGYVMFTDPEIIQHVLGSLTAAPTT